MGAYAGVLADLVRSAKYQPSLMVADQLGDWLGEAMAGLVDVDAIVPIPIPWFRRLRRGFDQADRLARGVSRSTGLPVLPLLFRSDYTRQVGKRASERAKLSPGAFGVRSMCRPSRVLLIDDVITTGATVHAAAQQLQRHGVDAVWAAVVADTRV